MVRRTGGVLVIAAATLALVASLPAQQQDKGKSAGTTVLTAKVVRVDVAKGILTVDDAGKERDFRVTPQTQIVGPRGAPNRERLKDERFAPGWEMKLTIAGDGKKLLKIQLPLRKEKKADKQ
jgi:hypothetical protein